MVELVLTLFVGESGCVFAAIRVGPAYVPDCVRIGSGWMEGSKGVGTAIFSRLNCLMHFGVCGLGQSGSEKGTGLREIPTQEKEVPGNESTQA